MAVIQILEFDTPGKTGTTFAKLYNTVTDSRNKVLHYVVETARGEQLHIIPQRKKAKHSISVDLWKGMCLAVKAADKYREKANEYAAILRSRNIEAPNV